MKTEPPPKKKTLFEIRVERPKVRGHLPPPPKIHRDRRNDYDRRKAKAAVFEMD
jgi:hypothetical protein